MDQLQPLDSLFLDIEDDHVQANIGGLSVLEGPAPSLDELARKIETRLRFTPRYRQRLQFLPLRLTSPVWVDDAEFDVANHLSHKRLPAPADHRRLAQTFADFVSQHIDRERPLWRICVYEGLPEGRWALGWKVHHAMVDGIAATEMLTLLLDFERDSSEPASVRWKPSAPPRRRRVLADTLTGPHGPSKPFRDLGRAISSPRHAVRRGRETVRALMPIGRTLMTANKSPLNGPIGPRRRWANARVSLDDVKTIGKTLGGTVNDVALAAVAGGIRELLKQRGEQLDGFDARSMVPVSMRVQDEQGKWANQVSAVFIELPVDIDDPVERLANVHEQMERAKRERGETAGEVLFGLAGYLPPPVWKLGERIGWRVADTQRLMNTITTNVPGPQSPLYCLGREMLELYPYVMLAKNIRVTTAIFSYNGNMYFGVTGDYDAVPDVELVGDGIEAGVAELLLIAAARANARSPAGNEAGPAFAADGKKHASAKPAARRKQQTRPKARTAAGRSTVPAKGR